MTLRFSSVTTFSGACVLALASWGCEPSGSVSVSNSSDEATVKGKVTVNGKLATGGEIIFDPSNIRRRDAAMRKAKIGEDGSYSVTTLVGENTASVDTPEIRKAGMQIQARKQVDIKAGENDLPLEIP